MLSSSSSAAPGRLMMGPELATQASAAKHNGNPRSAPGAIS